MLAALLVVRSAPAVAETLLHFSETAAVPAQPDELVAGLRANAMAATAQEAQSRVNAQIGAAVAEARAAPQIGVSTGAYNVFHVTEPRDAWQATEALRLRSHDGTALLGLVGALQSKGLAMEGFDWRLSDALAERTRDDALRRAIAALRSRAADAAELLGLRFDNFKAVTLDQDRSAPFAPRAMMAAQAPGPTAASEDIVVSATVEADAILQPK